MFVKKIGVLFVLLFLWFTPSAWCGNLNIEGGLIREATGKPGEKIEGKIEVRNPSDEVQTISVVASDYIFFANGRSFWRNPGSDPRSNGKWLSFTPNRLVIPPKTTGFVQYSIQVPQNDTLRGTYWSVLSFEALSKDHPEKNLDPKKRNVGIQTRMSYAVMMVTHIGSSGTKALRIIGKSLVSQKGNVFFRADIENSGERFLRPTVWVEIFDKGKSLGRFEGGKLRIFPGCSARFNINLSKVPKGSYTSLLTADTGDESIIGAKYQLDIK